VEETVKEWLRCDPYRDEVISSLTDTIDGEKEYFKRDLMDYLTNDLPGIIDDVAKDDELPGEGLAERLAEAAVLPMYGMPSRVRSLIHYLPKGSKNPWTIERDIEMAVTDFAPGAQKTKDKAVLTSVGFTAPLRARPSKKGYYWDFASADHDPIPFVRWVARCKVCGNISVYAEDVGAPTTCAECNMALEGDIEYAKVVTPAGFRTDFSEGRDSLEDEPYFGMVSTTAEKMEPREEEASGNYRLEFADQSPVWRVNDNRQGKNPRYFRGAIVKTSHYVKSLGHKVNLEPQWIAEPYIEELVDEKERPERTEEIAIGTRKVTNVMSFGPQRVPRGLNFDPLSLGGGVKAAVYSSAFLVQAVIAQALDIDPEELEICRVQPTRPDGGTIVGKVVLSDSLPNGSGFARWTYNNWRGVMDGVLGVPDPDSFVGRLVSDGHRLGDERTPPCRTACYQCLMSFRNMSYHGLLDWRLGLAYLRALNDPYYTCGLTEADYRHPELWDWLETAQQEGENFARLYGFEYHGPEGVGLPYLTREVNGVAHALVVHHPLWDRYARTGAFNTAVAGMIRKGYQPHGLDTFNLLRRPSWCYSQLCNELESTMSPEKYVTFLPL